MDHDRGQAVAAGFDRLSPFYDVMVALYPGNGIPRSQTLFLDRLTRADRALIVGGGTGGFLLSLLRAGFDGSVVNLDLSRGMTRRARRRIDRHAPASSGQIEFRCGTVAQLRSDERFDLICTHYFLDLFVADAMFAVMRRLDAALTPDGRWSCADFAHPRGPVARRLGRPLIRGLYGFFGRTCGIEPRALPPIRQGFERLGYEPAAERSLSGGMLWTAVFQRATGGDIQ